MGRDRGGRPKISLVFGVHNPAYAGDLLGRTQRCLRGLVELANRYRLALEVIIVEWNTHPGQAPFREGLSWPDSLGRVTLRFIEVPPEIHHRLPNADRMPIFEYLAKNVGLRRARGRYMLATNPDLFYSAALVRFLARSRLARRRFYRVDRSDLSETIPDRSSVDAQLMFCARHVSRVHTYCGSYTPPGPASPGRDWRASLEREYAAIRAGTPLPGGPPNGAEATLLSPFDGLHRNAAGDFFLMERGHWLEVRGYPELYTHAHIDAILCWVASSHGLLQTILPGRCRLYHQAHDRSLHATFPTTDWQLWYERYLKARRRGRCMLPNGEDWGLGREALREWVAGPGHMLRASEPVPPQEPRPGGLSPRALVRASRSSTDGEEA